MLRPASPLLLLVLALSTGCAPSPEKVCAHLDEVAAKEKATPVANCTFRMQMKYDTSRDEYNALAPCLMEANDMAGVNKCLGEHQKK